MSRFRWYHFYFLLAIFNVIVIMLSLEVLNRTLGSVTRLLAAETKLDARTNWLETARQRVVELNFPGNNLFETGDIDKEERRFDIARDNMTAWFEHPVAADFPDEDIRELTSTVDRMISSAGEVFGCFYLLAAEDDKPTRAEWLAEAGRSMAWMDREQQVALGALGRLSRPLATERRDLLDLHEHEVQRGQRDERYIIAAVILILLAALFFGRKLQQADRELAMHKKRLEEERRERLAAIGELCSSVAHGIRNPLAAIRSSAQLALETGHLDDESRERLNDIQTEGQRLGDRVTKLLNFARANVDSFEDIDLGQLVGAAIGELEPELARRRIDVEREFDDVRITVNADRHQLEQVVIELVSNAMEQSSAGDSIRVGCHRANGQGMASITVQDHGAGVPPESRERIFDLFFTTKPAGTGIGLATVRRIARLHGGEIEHDCPDEGGARFTVRLPAGSGKSGRPGGPSERAV